ncbi:hypothetical protein CLOM_g2183 [Closterium sp. NIES-68]|nr:hypothetical protein CLOM_g2183 [Closterium sp. NIES-68]GJP58438.1 hypothetical protein CLOP_g24989 [Closterium sp. NIES-67]GJP68804.1 hypothetical protein CLOP_g25459 [Closterium sp. NIES-67]
MSIGSYDDSSLRDSSMKDGNSPSAAAGASPFSRQPCYTPASQQRSSPPACPQAPRVSGRCHKRPMEPSENLRRLFRPINFDGITSS